MATSFPAPQFLFAVCQVGAEAVCKQEILNHHPELRLAYSRPGLLTLKIAQPEDPKPETTLTNWADHPTLISTFARTFGNVLQRFSGPDLGPLVESIGELVGEMPLESGRAHG